MNTLLTAPMARVAMERRQPEVPSRPQLLYVEDEEQIRQVAKVILTHGGYTVTTAADGEEGWAALETVKFDLVITDHNMPRLTGIELVARARRHGLTIPFIVASGSDECFTDAEYEWLRLAAVLKKPFTLNELLAAVRKVLPVVART
jgi:two-component system cell cycle sensor histidine kinase/response regulator CckA